MYGDVLTALYWIVDNGTLPGVVSMSLGGAFEETMNTAVDDLAAAGFVVSVAAGNDGGDACYNSPASADEALAVGSTTSDDEVSYFSSDGSCVSIYGPGSDIKSVSAGTSNQYMEMSGTSMACPHVSGVAALMLSENPDLTPEQVKDTLVCHSESSLLEDREYYGNAFTDNSSRYLLQVPPANFSVFDIADGDGQDKCAMLPTAAPTITSEPTAPTQFPSPLPTTSSMPTTSQPTPTPTGVPTSSMPTLTMEPTSSFDSFEDGWSGWTHHDSNYTESFIRSSGSTGSANTGPSGGAVASSYYVYAEASSPNYYTDFTMSKGIDSGSDAAKVAFSYHMYGANIGTVLLEGSQDDGSSYTTFWSKSGNMGDSWLSAAVDVSTSAPTGDSICYTLLMFDSYGDGWNNDTWHWEDSSGVHNSSTGTLESGSSGSDQLCVPVGDCMKFYVTDEVCSRCRETPYPWHAGTAVPQPLPLTQ